MKTKSRNITFMLYLTAVFSMLFMLVSNSAVADIEGSVHDFSAKSYTGGTGSQGTGQICVTCHTPHNSDLGETLLWNHTLSSVTDYTLYDSPTLQASGGTLGQPTGVSKLCLSCHDGTVAVDSFGGEQGGIDAPHFVAGQFAVGGDTAGLSNDHPISFTFDDALATADGALFPPSSTTVTIGDVDIGGKTKSGFLQDVMLIGGQVQCASCHDVHNNFTATGKLLRITMDGSTLCLTCHNK